MKRHILWLAWVMSLSAVTVPLSAHAEKLPKWELGAGAGLLHIPDYRGSDQSRTYLLPVPYLTYRGDFLKADRGGVQGMLFDSERVTASLSLNGTLPVSSRNNNAREGMSNLRPTIELGPTVEIRLWRTADEGMTLEFRAPVRTAITIESSPRQIGWLFAPSLNLDLKKLPGLPGWNVGLLAGPLFSDREYNSYFYSVGADAANAARPQYSAPGGYAGSQLTIAISKRYARYWVGGFVRYDTLAGAVFRDSPLVRESRATSAGIAISWVFGQSSRLVEVPD